MDVEQIFEDVNTWIQVTIIKSFCIHISLQDEYIPHEYKNTQCFTLQETEYIVLSSKINLNTIEHMLIHEKYPLNNSTTRIHEQAQKSTKNCHPFSKIP
jgi:hypothetical protein